MFPGLRFLIGPPYIGGTGEVAVAITIRCQGYKRIPLWLLGLFTDGFLSQREGYRAPHPPPHPPLHKNTTYFYYQEARIRFVD